MIKTKPVKLTPKQYFKIIMSNYLRRRLWLYIIVWLLTILLIFIKFDTFTIVMIVFSIVYPVALVIMYRRFAYSKENKIAFIERYYELDDKKMTAFLEDGTINPYKLEYITRIQKNKAYWLLYISKTQFIYFPINCFNSEEDFKYFQNIVQNK